MEKAKKIRRASPRPPGRSRLFGKWRHPYRLVFIDDATLDEVASFKLTKRSVWTAFSALSVVLIVLTATIIVFSPLKYYIPGYGSGKVRGRVLRLQQTADSLADQLTAQTTQMERLRAVIQGENPVPRDTTMLPAKEIARAEQESALPTAAAVEAAATPAQVPEKRSRRR